LLYLLHYCYLDLWPIHFGDYYFYKTEWTKTLSNGIKN
jgi:hypothetical protein